MESKAGTVPGKQLKSESNANATKAKYSAACSGGFDPVRSSALYGDEKRRIRRKRCWIMSFMQGAFHYGPKRWFQNDSGIIILE